MNRQFIAYNSLLEAIILPIRVFGTMQFLSIIPSLKTKKTQLAKSIYNFEILTYFTTPKAREFMDYGRMFRHPYHSSRSYTIDSYKKNSILQLELEKQPMDITTFPNPTDTLHHLMQLRKIKEISFNL